MVKDRIRAPGLPGLGLLKDENARKYTEIPELTSEILHTFIQRVEVGERAERYSRTAPQEIRIYYRDIGIVDDIPETMDISELYEEYPDDVA